MEVTSYPSEKRMNTNINNLLYMNDENKMETLPPMVAGKWLISRSRHLVKSKN